MITHGSLPFHHFCRTKSAPYTVIALALALLLIPFGSASASHTTNPDSARTVVEIHVSGDASMSVMPDKATVVLAVDTQAETAPEAQEENARRIQAVMNALNKTGIDKDAVETTNFRLNPVWSHPSATRSGSDQPVIIGYRASHDVRIKAPSIDGVGAVIDTAVKAGADRVSHIEFSVSNAAEYRDDLLRAAFADARSKAHALATAADLTLTVPAHINESGFTPFPVRAPARMAMADAAFAETHIMPDEQQLTVRIDVTFLAVPAP